MRTAFGVFLIFHAMVHAMYIGQALRWFELRPTMPWPIGSWALSSLSDGALRTFSAVTVGVASLGIALGGVGLLADWGWSGWVAIGGAALASVVHALLWSGKWSEFGDCGGYGVVINVGIIATILILRG